MADKELLELAAKACNGHPLTMNSGNPYRPWSPLEDDGDALRLAVDLSLKITHYPIYTFPKHSVIVSYKELAPEKDDENTFIGPEIIELYGENKQAATRRAIVRAAAEIGRSMK